MNYRTLGKTGLEVSELAMGGLFVASMHSDLHDSKAAVLRAFELGVNYIDTAPNYANSEEVLGKFLCEAQAPFIFSTKLGGRPVPFLPQDRDCLLKSVEMSLELLKRDTIDILIIHEPDRPDEYDWWTNKDDFYGPVLDVFDELKNTGTIKFTGLGGSTVYEMEHIVRRGKFDVVLTAFNYNLLWREAERVISAAKEMEMGIIIGSPLQQGALAKKQDLAVRWLNEPRRRQFCALYDLADEIGIALPELALRFAISNPDVSCVLTGARSLREIEQNVAAVEKGPLSDDVLAKLSKIAAMVPYRPFEEPFVMPFGREYYGPGIA